MMKIQILHIIKSLGRGGAEMLLPETLAIHDKEKFDFHFIYFLPWKDQMVSEIQKKGGNVRCLQAKNNFQLISKFPQIIDYCDENQIDVIHCHLPWAGFVGRIVYNRTKIPMIYTEHNMQERYHPITKILNKKSFNFQSLAVGVSQDVSDSIIKNIKPQIPVKTILNGVNTNKFIRNYEDSDIRKKYGIPEDALVVGLVSVFRFQKRIKEWIQVFKTFSDNTSKKVYGLIVGAGPLEDEIKKEVTNFNLEEMIIMPGLQEQTKPYYNAMDIFMMSSSFEGLPIALLEAMSMECAIVTTNAGGIKEVINDGEEGLMVEVDQWKVLSEKLIFLSENPAELKDLQRAARNRVISDFSLKSMVENLEKEYSELAV
ncbi:N-acetyl-alpha-D-glucosaminyl L-malate synthase BshA [Pontixanthobacter gangjinensis]|uniref:Glycosyltransferase family 4 protein n=1 Tax=Christiangramia aestuarii TaxID=1028746 RepID=A0A7M3SWS6_9FLAO|nr:glycosyltransferase family 4 protein [Christiangramia aestuarii]MUP41057.1 glycosyltransferase family 4 protein [Christiangramia aestuarii]